MKKLLINISLLLTLVLWVGCAPKGIDQSTVGQNMTVEPGVVQSVKQVAMDNNGVGNTLGGIVGSVAGSVAGAHVGGGTGRIVSSVLGSVIGGVVGGSAGDTMDTNYGQEVIVKLNNGQTVATVLRINGATELLQVGQAVNVFSSGSQISNISAR
ncbi:MAG: Outer membrane lipoprotein [uncultured Sulfurovum sp.]|uniref:Outer membrane lipoprotein n=1 Tax=uncultured Sulfurovum sp. TaxID=269237 RepID=A0A6S6SMN4_9BACT|nr:MAG: Outer membrane lipoprotein [uncultured Sulfurovum sp.]